MRFFLFFLLKFDSQKGHGHFYIKKGPCGYMTPKGETNLPERCIPL